MYEAFNRNVFAQVQAQASGDLEVVLVAFGQTVHGPKGFAEFLQGFKSAFPDITITLTNQIATEDRVVSEFIARGTHSGPFQTPAGVIPPTGRTIDYPACEVWEMKGGRVTSIHNYFDSATVLRQLGLST